MGYCPLNKFRKPDFVSRDANFNNSAVGYPCNVLDLRSIIYIDFVRAQLLGLLQGHILGKIYRWVLPTRWLIYE